MRIGLYTFFRRYMYKLKNKVCGNWVFIGTEPDGSVNICILQQNIYFIFIRLESRYLLHCFLSVHGTKYKKPKSRDVHAIRKLKWIF